jgi:hypothetical protein
MTDEAPRELLKLWLLPATMRRLEELARAGDQPVAALGRLAVERLVADEHEVAR